MTQAAARRTSRPDKIEFPRMAQVVKPGEKGVAKVEHFTITQKDSKWSSVMASIHMDSERRVSPGRYAKLSVNGQLMMTDTDMERRTNRWPFMYKANGRVLIAGLGLGMVIHGILRKTEVQHVTVVEKYQDVVDLVAPSLRKYGRRVSIVVADIFEWPAPKGEKWDTIYFDIWPDMSVDTNLPEAARLSRKFSPRLNRTNPDAWMGGWQLDHLRAVRDMDRGRFWP